VHACAPARALDQQNVPMEQRGCRAQPDATRHACYAGGRWLDWQPPVCAPMDNMALTPDPAAQQLCVHAAPIYTRRARAGEEHKVLQYAFEQYDSELHAMRRWLQVGEICDHGLSHPFGAPGTNPVPCNADVLVFPSLWLHDYLMHGRGWNVAECMGRAAHRFLDRMVKVWRNAGSRATVVLVETLPFNLVTERQLLRALTRLPPQLVRLVIGCSMSNLPITMQQVYREHYGGWQPGAARELGRREALAGRARAGEAIAPLAAEVGGPVLVTLPYTVGVSHPPDWFPTQQALGSARQIALLYYANPGRKSVMRDHAPVQYVRPLIMSALKRKGAWCAMTSGLCTLIRGKEEGALKAAFNLGGMYAASTRATFCIEPPGDSLDRSHVYVSILSGCIPVLWVGGHGMYDRKEPAWWPFRAPPVAMPHSHLLDTAAGSAAEPRSPSPKEPRTVSRHATQLLQLQEQEAVARARLQPACARTLDFDTFVVWLDAPIANSTKWIDWLLAREDDAEWLAAKREALADAAHVFTYAQADCGADDCDALALFQGAVARAWRAAEALWPNEGVIRRHQSHS